MIWADKRWRLGHGRAFALYVAAYTVGRGWIEYLRVDDVNHFLGLRLNDWTSLILFMGAVSYLVITRDLKREAVVDHAPGETLDEATAAYETGVAAREAPVDGDVTAADAPGEAVDEAAGPPSRTPSPRKPPRPPKAGDGSAKWRAVTLGPGRKSRQVARRHARSGPNHRQDRGPRRDPHGGGRLTEQDIAAHRY